MPISVNHNPLIDTESPDIPANDTNNAIAGLVALDPLRQACWQSAKNVEFIPVTPENIRELRSLNSVLFPMTYQERYYREVLAYDSLSKLGTMHVLSKVLIYNPTCVVYCKRRLAATFSTRLQVFYNADGVPLFECYVMTFGVLAPFRRIKLGIRAPIDWWALINTRLGSLMLQSIIDFYQRKGEVRRISLHVHTINDVALKFYLKHGFRLVDMVADYYRKLTPSTAYLLRYDFAR